MASQHPLMTGSDNRVIPFKPRSVATSPGIQAGLTDGNAALRNDLHDPDTHRKIESADQSKGGDYRHRMITNLAALIFTLLLTAVGVWLATTITELRKTQDCLMVGRRDCTKMPPLSPYPPGAEHSI
jgi:hypothetical protein